MLVQRIRPRQQPHGAFEALRRSPSPPPFATDLSLSLGSVLSLQDGAAAAHPTVGRLNATRAVACWVDDANSDYLRCAALTLQGATALAMGAVTSVRSYTRYPSVAPLAEDKAVVCWLDVTSSEYGLCSVLLVAADGAITHGTFTSARAARLYTSYPSVSVTALDGEWGIVCWSRTSSSYCYCSTLHVSAGSDTELSYGTALYVTYPAEHPAVAALDNSSVMTPGSTTAWWLRASMDQMRFMRRIDSAMPPWTGSAPPLNPVRAPAAVTGTPWVFAHARIDDTSAVLSGSITTSGMKAKSSVSSEASSM